MLPPERSSGADPAGWLRVHDAEHDRISRLEVHGRLETARRRPRSRFRVLERHHVSYLEIRAAQRAVLGGEQRELLETRRVDDSQV
jgi:hypothetical protein